jgi:hypothetical protein
VFRLRPSSGRVVTGVRSSVERVDCLRGDE